MSEPVEDIARFPLLGAIKGISKTANRLDATIVTTFAFNGPFYEDVLLRSFERAGSRLNIVLVDARQLADSLADEMRRPRRAGRDYVLCPIEHARAFHPKVMVLLSEKQRGLGVGSHNLTDAGYGHNEEVSTFWDIRHDAPAGLVEPAVEYCLSWLERARTLPDETLKEVAQRLRSLARPRRGEVAPDAKALECSLALDGEDSLWRQLEGAVNGAVGRAFVAGPYFDQDFGFLRRLSEVFAPKDFIVAIEPEMVLFGDPKRLPTKVRFVDLCAITTAPKRKGDPRFSHAKLIALETVKGWVVSTGSANPTKAGWGIGAPGNAEANVILSGARAAEAVARLGLERLGSARSIEHAELEAAASRSAEQRHREKEEEKQKNLPPLLHGALREGAIVLDTGVHDVDLTGLEIWTSALEPWSTAASIVRSGAAVECKSGEPFVSGLYSLRRMREVVAYILVHDTVALRTNSTSREATQLLANLGRIDQYEGFDEVFELVTRHIVDVEPRARASAEGAVASRKSDKSDGSEEVRAGPRGVSLADDRIAKSRKRLLEHSFVSDLISTLIASLYTAGAPPPPARDGDAPDLDLEETEDGEEGGEGFASNVDASPQIKDVDWPLVTKTCRHRASVLINRLKKKLAKSEPDPIWELGKLLSVLCLVQKLRAMPPPADMVWSAAPDSLVRWDQLENLYVFTVAHVYGEGRLSERLAEAGGANAQERLLLDNLLLWYARELGVDCDEVISTAEDTETRDDILQDRADLVVIAFSAAGGESELWLKERANALSRWSDSGAVARDWFDRHRTLGERLQSMLVGAGAADRKAGAIKDGGYAIWKQEAMLPRVVRSVASDKATLFEPGGGEMRSFKLSSVDGIDLGSRQPS